MNATIAKISKSKHGEFLLKISLSGNEVVPGIKEKGMTVYMWAQTTTLVEGQIIEEFPLSAFRQYVKDAVIDIKGVPTPMKLTFITTKPA